MISPETSPNHSPSHFQLQSLLKNKFGHGQAARYAPYQMSCGSSSGQSPYYKSHEDKYVIGAGKHYRKRDTVPSFVREAMREHRFLIKHEEAHKNKQYMNREGFLPKIKPQKNAWYIENRIGQAREGDPRSAGKWRSVMKVEERRKGLNIPKQYYSNVHYNDNIDKRRLSFVEKGKRNKRS